MPQRRAVITGIGVVTPIGVGSDAFWHAAVRGVNGVRPVQSFDAGEFRTKVGAEVLDFDPGSFLSKSETARMGRSSQFAVAATSMALEEARLEPNSLNPYRIGVVMGTTMGEPQILEEGIRGIYRHPGPEGVPVTLPRQYPCNVISTNVARRLGARGPLSMIPTACAAGNYAIGYASDLVKLNRADVVIAGGSDPFSRIAFTGFNRLLATSAEACRPFDKNRDGMAVGEGAGILVVEELEHARARGASVAAEVVGYGLGCDAFKMTIPDPAGGGGIEALRRAISTSGIEPGSIDYVCAHGTGTRENDKSETVILKNVLGEAAYATPVSSLKSMIGHTMGAASAIEAAACVLMMRKGTILPTINYSDPDPECDLDYVPNRAREKELNIVVSNAYAFGGNTSSLILRRMRGEA